MTPNPDPKQHSRIITDGPERAGARAMLKGIGFTDDDLAQVNILRDDFHGEWNYTILATQHPN